MFGEQLPGNQNKQLHLKRLMLNMATLKIWFRSNPSIKKFDESSQILHLFLIPFTGLGAVTSETGKLYFLTHTKNVQMKEKLKR